MFTHFSPKTTIFALLRGHFWPKTWKIKCFQFIQSKISQFVTQMWLPKKLQFLVPGTPPDPPIPPLTPPPGVRGSQKWPKCIPSSPIMIINAKKAISGGSKILTYFFTRNVPISASKKMQEDTLYRETNTNDILRCFDTVAINFG